MKPNMADIVLLPLGGWSLATGPPPRPRRAAATIALLAVLLAALGDAAHGADLVLRVAATVGTQGGEPVGLPVGLPPQPRLRRPHASQALALTAAVFRLHA